ncbi:MAG: DUF2953 domain-containing protein, partial [Firmicutes bacterium]|nr:DUF2953 domain-containing protein [Bacillota bacterium]
LKPRVKSHFWPVPRPVFKIKTEVEGKGGRPVAGKKTDLDPVQLLGMAAKTMRLMKKYYPALVSLMARIHLRRFLWKTEMGSGDPALTGFLVGTAWGVKTFLLTLFYRMIHPGAARPSLGVAPNFEKTCFNTTLDCIFEVRIGHIIVTGFKAIILWFK